MEIAIVVISSVTIVTVETLLSIDVLRAAISFVSFALLGINEDATQKLIA